MQLFQVLKCYKCLVFQVHQTKKTQKWECKMCGEKQSIKRHYGLGTGKECRLHVQKLNGIRGEGEDLHVIENMNESTDEEDDNVNLNVAKINTESKWLGFVDKTERTEPECKETMFLGNAEVVLELPAKKRKFSKPTIKKSVVPQSIKADSDIFYNKELPSPQLEKDPNTKTNIKKCILETNKIETNIKIEESKVQRKNKHFVPEKIERNSKWAQFAEESDAENNEYDAIDNGDNEENYLTNEIPNSVNLGSVKSYDENLKTSKDLPRAHNLFSLCDENDLDDVLDI